MRHLADGLIEGPAANRLDLGPGLGEKNGEKWRFFEAQKSAIFPAWDRRF